MRSRGWLAHVNETRALARFVAQTRFTDLPRGLVDNCKLMVLDTFAAGFVGSAQPWARGGPGRHSQDPHAPGPLALGRESRTCATPARGCRPRLRQRAPSRLSELVTRSSEGFPDCRRLPRIWASALHTRAP